MVSRFDEVDIAIVGIGILEPSLLKTSGNYYHEDMQVLAARGAVGDICLHYYDKTAIRCYAMMKIQYGAGEGQMPERGRAGRRYRQSRGHQGALTGGYDVSPITLPLALVGD